MIETRILMGMPVTIEIADACATKRALDDAFSYFAYVDEKFSTYKDASEITRFNKGEIKEDDLSDDMRTIFALAEKTKKETDGYFDIFKDEQCDPSGIVKGWAINNVCNILINDGFKNFYVDAGGDIEAHGMNQKGEEWKVGIQNPFNPKEIIKTVYIQNKGIATSGAYIRGDHIYNPKDGNASADEIASMTVIGPNIYDADRFATAAFAMGKKGIDFIEKLGCFEGYMIDKDGMATMTSGFEKYMH